MPSIYYHKFQNLVYQARDSSLVLAEFLTAQFLQKLYIYEATVYTFPFLHITTKVS